MSSQQHAKGTVLSLYKNLLKQAQLVTESVKRQRYVKEIRETFRENATKEYTAELLAKQIQLARDKIAFLKVITPKMVTSSNNASSPKSSNTTVFVVDRETGQVIDLTSPQTMDAVDLEKQEKTKYSNWGAGNVDPDQLAKHKYLLDRQYFREGPLKDRPKNMYNYVQQKVKEKLRPRKL